MRYFKSDPHDDPHDSFGMEDTAKIHGQPAAGENYNNELVPAVHAEMAHQSAP